MMFKVFTVYDSKAECYLPPIYVKSKGEVIRSIGELANNPEHNFGKYPEDYTLFEVGSWNDNDCKFDLLSTPNSMGVILEFKREK